MAYLILAVGLVLCVEGLAISLAPSRIEEVLEQLRKLSLDTRRMIGLGALAAGVVLIWLAQTLLA
nr:DUF2065 domain-containing protein [Actibacterium ureilyticum]